MLRFSIILAFWVLFFGLQNVASAQIYVRIHEERPERVYQQAVRAGMDLLHDRVRLYS